MSRDKLRGTRILYVPDWGLTESETNALRRARLEGNDDLDDSVVFSEQLLEDTAQFLSERGHDAERLLRILRLPSPKFDLDSTEMYGRQTGAPSFPAEGVRIDLGEIRWLVRFCEDTIDTINAASTEEINDSLEKKRWLLSRLQDFAQTVLRLEIRPELSRN